MHVLVEIPNSGDFSKIVNKVKGATGTVYQKTPEYADFSGWAAGFDSFSVSFSDLHRLRRHIEEQHTIHQEISFEEEYGQLLEENGFDPHQTSVPASSTVHFPRIPTLKRNQMIYTKYILFSLLLVCPSVLSAQGITRRIHQIDEVTVWGKRPMKEIGVQKTKFDSLALKENIALSMADILTFNSSVFVKSYGRATLSTVAFRGTSPSHTQVTWNGMRINNPMLGMTDFSTIPSYFIDQASLLHGTSSVNETGGGLGGLVKLGTTPQVGEGFHAQYVQGIGSFRTFDEFARFTYGSDRWQVSTRAVYSSSPNDYKYTNHDKKINIYDEEKNIIGQYHPKERNRSGSFKDLHLLQEVYYNTLKGDRFGLNAWYINSNRELPMLTTDYGDETAFENRQREQTFRGVLSWDHIKEKWKVGVKGGYIHTWMAYDYRREVAPDNWASMTRSRSKINTFYGQAEAEYSPGRKWFFTSNVSVYQHLVRSEDKNIILQDGNKAVVGYDKGRVELSGSVSAKWQPVEPLGLSLVLREEMSGDKWAPLIPAFFIDGLISRKGNVMVKASVSRNYRFPTLNDLYFLPGGNPDLKTNTASAMTPE